MLDSFLTIPEEELTEKLTEKADKQLQQVRFQLEQGEAVDLPELLQDELERISPGCFLFVPVEMAVIAFDRPDRYQEFLSQI